MLIDKITIKNYKVIKELEISELNRPTFIVGGSETGKSSFCEALEFLRLGMSNKLSLLRNTFARNGVNYLTSADGDEETLIEFMISGRDKAVETFNFEYTLRLHEPNNRYELLIEEEKLVARDKKSDETYTTLEFDGKTVNAILNPFSGSSSKAGRDQKQRYTNMAINPDLLTLPIFGGYKSEVISPLNRCLKDFCVYSFNPHKLINRDQGNDQNLAPDGSNLLPLLFRFQESERQTFTGIISAIKSLYQDIENLVVEKGPESRFLLRIERKNPNLPVYDAAGEGLLRILSLLCLLRQPQPYSLLLIDCPETGLDRAGKALAARELVEYGSRGNRLIAATNSERLLNEVLLVSPPEKRAQVFQLEKEDGFSHGKRLVPETESAVYKCGDDIHEQR
ncbi:MAG: hypothetical protein Q4C86_05800 [bacterium]|nr:hypothetical protein [bacterium]